LPAAISASAGQPTPVSHQFGAGDQRLLDSHVLKAVFVPMLSASILGPVLTECFAPRLPVGASAATSHEST
jgi:hypothetical protein